VTHFEGISSTEPGVYTLSADSLQTGSTNAAQGSWVSVRRNSDGTFDKGTWVDLNYPDSPNSIASSNSVYGYEVVGLVIGAELFAYDGQRSLPVVQCDQR
jgi:trimeric autotransporter adhesin